MKQERVQEYYEMLKFYYLKSDSDWTDKAKSIRTVAHDFYKEITRTYGTFAEALKEFYKWNKYNDVSNAAFCLKDQLNDVVHQNKKVDKATYQKLFIDEKGLKEPEKSAEPEAEKTANPFDSLEEVETDEA